MYNNTLLPSTCSVAVYQTNIKPIVRFVLKAPKKIGIHILLTFSDIEACEIGPWWSFSKMGIVIKTMSLLRVVILLNVAPEYYTDAY